MKTLLMLAVFSVVMTETVFSQKPASPPAKPKGDGSVFPPMRIPPGRFVTEAEAAKLADAGDLREVLYLVGRFKVTATGANRAVLRSDSKAGRIRIVAEYPESIPAPAEGTKVIREKSPGWGFLIIAIRRGQDGVITVYVRESPLSVITAYHAPNFGALEFAARIL